MIRIATLGLILFCQIINAQFRSSLYDDNQLSISLRGGADFPSYDNQTKYVDYKPNLNIGTSVDFYFNWIGLGIDFDYLKNSPKNTYPSSDLYNNSTRISNPSLNENDVNRIFIGAGPNFRWVLNDEISLALKVKGGIANIKGGETVLSSSPLLLNYHNGYDARTVLSGKAQMEFNWFFSEHIGVNAGAYYIQHFGAEDLAQNNTVAGYIPFTENNGQNNLTTNNALIRNSSLKHEIHSAGVFAGLTFRIPTEKKAPNFNLTVIAKDQETGIILPDTFVELYKDGKRAYFARTNAQGVAFFKNIKPDNYEIRGNLYNIDLVSNKAGKNEFVKNSTLKKDISTDAAKFFVKGQVNVCKGKGPLRDVSVVIKNNQDGSSRDAKTDINGRFYFKADKNTTYTIYGKKGNYFSQTEIVSSQNADRSNTLFLNLQVCMEETTCGKAINLQNIHYDLDKYEIREDAKSELNKLVQFMKDNPNVKVELASHTDSRASDDYNKNLSQNRANAAVDYLVSNGIGRARLQAVGYGETRLLNACSNGSDCTEEQHQINRRTEMKVICP